MCRARSRFSGRPHSPKPLIRILDPEKISKTASSDEEKIFFEAKRRRAQRMDNILDWKYEEMAAPPYHPHVTLP